MQEVEHRICLAFVVARRRVDAHTTLQAQFRAVVPDVGNVSVLNFVVLIEVTAIAFFLADNKGTHEGANVAAALNVACVLRLNAIHIETVAVEFRGKDFRGVAPNAVLIRHLLVPFLNAIADNGYLLGLWSLDAKSDCAVVVKLRRTCVVSLENGLLSL